MDVRADKQSRAASSTPLWMIVLAAAAVAGIGMGLRQVMGLYMKPVTSELGLGREAFAFAIAVANLVWGFGAPVFGGVADRYGAGRVVLAGCLSTAIGILAMRAATTDIHLLVSGFFLGLGVAGAGVNALVGTVGRRAAPEQRSAAVAKIGMGSGIGMLVALPYTHLLIESFGWKGSLYVLAATALFMLPLAYTVSGTPHVIAQQGPKQTLREALTEALNHRSFWLLNAGFFVCGFHVVFYGTHLPSYVADKGMGNGVAVAALTVVGLGNLIGTYLAGEWGRRRPKRLGLCFIYLGRAVVFLGFLFLPITPVTVIGLSAALGLLWLSTVPLTSTLVATFFGPTWMTMLYGIVFFSHQLGSFSGVWLGGWVFDRTGSYDLMWWISVALGLFAAAVHWPIDERPVARLAEAAKPA